MQMISVFRVPDYQEIHVSVASQIRNLTKEENNRCSYRLVWKSVAPCFPVVPHRENWRD